MTTLHKNPTPLFQTPLQLLLTSWAINATGMLVLKACKAQHSVSPCREDWPILHRNGPFTSEPHKEHSSVINLAYFLSSCPNYGAVTCSRRPALLLPDNIVVPHLLKLIKPSITSKHSWVFDNTLTEDSSINCFTKCIDVYIYFHKYFYSKARRVKIYFFLTVLLRILLLSLRSRKRSEQLRLLLPIKLSLTRHQRLFLSAAFLGDIALDEEDLQMFKVDRIIDWAQRTIKIINHTQSGKNVTSNKFRSSPSLL